MQVYIGIDWSENKHDVALVNDAGAMLAQFTIPHAPDGFAKFDATRRDMGFGVDECLVVCQASFSLCHELGYP
jgi:transposase